MHTIFPKSNVNPGEYPRFSPYGRSGSFLIAMMMLIHLRMPSCEAQVLLWGRDLDNTVVTFDFALYGFMAGDKGPDHWLVRWDGLVLEYEFMRKRAAALIAINATGIVSGSLALGVSKGFEKDELGLEFKTMGGLLIFPVDLTIIPAYSYRDRDFVINAAASIGLGILFPVFNSP